MHLKNLSMKPPSRRAFCVDILRWGLLSTSGLSVWVDAMAAQAREKNNYQSIDWRDLMPPNWHPGLQLKAEMADKINELKKEDLNTILQERLKDIYQRAPVNAALHQKRIQLSGYTVPLDDAQRGLKEFLLVPTFGACIHTPPPPQNQIVYVISSTPLEDVGLMDALTVRGQLSVKTFDNSMGRAAYTLGLESFQPYQGS